MIDPGRICIDPTAPDSNLGRPLLFLSRQLVSAYRHYALGSVKRVAKRTAFGSRIESAPDRVALKNVEQKIK